MSTYVREKVLRIPREKMNFAHIVRKLEEKFPGHDVMDDLTFYIEKTFPDLFGYGDIKKFQIAPTVDPFIDYVLEYEYDCEGEYGKIRCLYDSEKAKYGPIFEKIDPDIDMNNVKLIEFCWYNGCEAPSYYRELEDDFYKEV